MSFFLFFGIKIVGFFSVYSTIITQTTVNEIIVIVRCIYKRGDVGCVISCGYPAGIFSNTVDEAGVPPSINKSIRN